MVLVQIKPVRGQFKAWKKERFEQVVKASAFLPVKVRNNMRSAPGFRAGLHVMQVGRTKGGLPKRLPVDASHAGRKSKLKKAAEQKKPDAGSTVVVSTVRCFLRWLVAVG